MTRDERCDNCGYPKSSHWEVNHSDGPLVSGPVLICPKAVWTPAVARFDAPSPYDLSSVNRKKRKRALGGE